MRASAAVATTVNGGHPSWVYVDDEPVTDDSKGTDSWAKEVLVAICTAAAKKGLKVPDACSA